MITIIAAVTSDKMGLGRAGELLYRLSPDMKHFKTLTMGHPIIMGRKTFESFPKGALPGRRNMVISRSETFSAPGAEVFRSIDDALAALAPEDDAYIIGGGEIYRQLFPVADRLELTLIHATSPDDTDTFFPEIDNSRWTKTSESEVFVDEKTGIPYQFICLSRI